MIAEQSIHGTKDSGIPIIQCKEEFVIGPRLARFHFSKAWAKFPSARQSLIKLALLCEKYKGRNSKYFVYIDALPVKLDLPIFWPSEQQLWLKGTNVYGSLDSKVESWKVEYNTLKEIIGEDKFYSYPSEVDEDNIAVGTPPPPPPADISSEEYAFDCGPNPNLPFSFKQYAWACGIFMSRAFPARVVYDDEESKDLSMLVPVVDSLNHQPGTPVLWDGKNGAGFTFSVCHSVEPGAQVFNNYGAKTNEELLFGYGFCIEAAEPFDTVTLKMEHTFSTSISDLLKKCNIHDGAPAIFLLSKSAELDPKIIELFAFLCMPPYLQTEASKSGFTLAEQVSGLTALNIALQKKLQALDAYKPEDVQEEENIRFDYVQLYRRSQRTILEKSIREVNELKTLKLGLVTKHFDLAKVLNPGPSGGDDEVANDITYFADMRSALPSIFGYETAQEFDESGAYEQALCVVIAYERLKGSSSRYSDNLEKLWDKFVTVNEEEEDEEERERYEQLYESMFPAVVKLDPVMFGNKGWSGRLLAEAGAIMDRNAYTFRNYELRVLFD